MLAASGSTPVYETRLEQRSDGATMALARKLVAAGAPDAPWRACGVDGGVRIFGPSLKRLSKLTVREGDERPKLTPFVLAEEFQRLGNPDVLVWDLHLEQRPGNAGNLDVAWCEWRGKRIEAVSILRGAALRSLASIMTSLCAPDAPWTVHGLIGGVSLHWLAQGKTVVIEAEGSKLRFATADEIEEIEAVRQSPTGLQ